MYIEHGDLDPTFLVVRDILTIKKLKGEKLKKPEEEMVVFVDSYLEKSNYKERHETRTVTKRNLYPS